MLQTPGAGENVYIFKKSDDADFLNIGIVGVLKTLYDERYKIISG
jgi:hypothetical protein